MASRESNPPDMDEDLHSPQLAVFGQEAMPGSLALTFLSEGCRVLAWRSCVILHDVGTVELWDLSNTFVLSDNDVGKNRATMHGLGFGMGDLVVFSGIHDGVVIEVKQPRILNFKPLREAITGPGNFLKSDPSKPDDRSRLFHVVFQVMDKFISELSRFPIAGSEDDAQKLISVASTINDSFGDIGEIRRHSGTLPLLPGRIKDCHYRTTLTIVLTWSRSEFEGLLKKTPVEVNAYLSDPSAYTNAVRIIGDAKARAAKLERVLECLEREKCENFEDCITWARGNYLLFYGKKHLVSQSRGKNPRKGSEALERVTMIGVVAFVNDRMKLEEVDEVDRVNDLIIKLERLMI
ncbi:hypothetical protein VNO78_08164 [Psophocarpus tetragonolobus]|uniref:Uncharacterized protein n=1 Tax=Psophocarpus tetragonolobus TaxID=3891 RepID=A0AAN9XSC9_PSOTE